MVTIVANRKTATNSLEICIGCQQKSLLAMFLSEKILIVYPSFPKFLAAKPENTFLTFCPLTPTLSPLGRGEG
jgi:hypothetical protein